MGIFNKKINTVKVAQEDLDDAKLSSVDFSDEGTKKRAFINVLGARLAMKMLFSKKAEANNLYSMYSVHRVLEELDIADIYYKNVKMDVRVVFNSEEIFVPKSHFNHDILPDAYLFFQLKPDFTAVDFLGYVEPSKINQENQNHDFYFVEKDQLNAAEDIKKFVEKFVPDLKIKPTEEEFERAENLFLSFVDDEISVDDFNFLIKQLASDIELREKIVEFENFEFVSKRVARDESILQDGVLDIIGAQKAFEEKEEVKEELQEEVLEQNAEESLSTEDVEELSFEFALDELELAEEGTEKVKDDEEKEDSDSNGGLGKRLAEGAIVAGGAALAGGLVSAGMAAAAETSVIGSATAGVVGAIANAAEGIASTVGSVAENIESGSIEVVKEDFAFGELLDEVADFKESAEDGDLSIFDEVEFEEESLDSSIDNMDNVLEESVQDEEQSVEELLFETESILEESPSIVDSVDFDLSELDSFVDSDDSVPLEENEQEEALEELTTETDEPEYEVLVENEVDDFPDSLSFDSDTLEDLDSLADLSGSQNDFSPQKDVQEESSLDEIFAETESILAEDSVSVDENIEELFALEESTEMTDSTVDESESVSLLEIQETVEEEKSETIEGFDEEFAPLDELSELAPLEELETLDSDNEQSEEFSVKEEEQFVDDVAATVDYSVSGEDFDVFNQDLAPLDELPEIVPLESLDDEAEIEAETGIDTYVEDEVFDAQETSEEFTFEAMRQQEKASLEEISKIEGPKYEAEEGEEMSESAEDEGRPKKKQEEGEGVAFGLDDFDFDVFDMSARPQPEENELGESSFESAEEESDSNNNSESEQGLMSFESFNGFETEPKEEIEGGVGESISQMPSFESVNAELAELDIDKLDDEVSGETSDAEFDDIAALASQVDDFLKETELSDVQKNILAEEIDTESISSLTESLAKSEVESEYKSENSAPVGSDLASDIDELLSGNMDEDDDGDLLKVLFKQENIDETEDFELGSREAKPSFFSDKKKVIVAASVAGVMLVSIVAGGVVMNKKNSAANVPNNLPQAASQNQMPGGANADGMSQASGDATGSDSQMSGMDMSSSVGAGGAIPAASQAKNRDMGQAVSDAFMSEPMNASVSKVAWEVPEEFAYNDVFRKYLQSAGKNLKLTLQNDLLLATEMAYSNKCVVDLTISGSGAVQSANVIASSGSKQIDKIVLQSVKDTLKYLKAPTGELGGKSVEATLIINF